MSRETPTPSPADLALIQFLDDLVDAQSSGAMYGIGCDTVSIPHFVEQCTTEGTSFTSVFTAREVFYAHRNCTGSPFDPAQAWSWGPHLAARWAAREAFIKAWSSVLEGQPPVIPDTPDLFRHIAVMHDTWKRPILLLAQPVRQAFERSCPGMTARVSLSHDENQAVAMVLISATPPPASVQEQSSTLTS